MAASRRRRGVAVAAVVAALTAVAAAGAAAAQTGAEPGAAELAARYAPIVVTRDQEGACDRSGEAYRPTGVDVHINSQKLKSFMSTPFPSGGGSGLR